MCSTVFWEFPGDPLGWTEDDLSPRWIVFHLREKPADGPGFCGSSVPSDLDYSVS